MEHESVADTVVAPEGGENAADGDDEVQLVQENEIASSTTPSSTRRQKMSPTDITCLQEALRLVTTPSRSPAYMIYSVPPAAGNPRPIIGGSSLPSYENQRLDERPH